SRAAAREARDRRHVPLAGDLADRIVVGITDVDIPRAVDADAAARVVEARVRASSIGGAHETGPARERAHHAVAADLANRAVVEIGYIEIARRVHGNRVRAVK